MVTFYRERFEPSPALAAPFSLIAAIVVVGETDAEAERLALPTALAFLRLRQGEYGPYPTLEDAANAQLNAGERAFVADWLDKNIVGGPSTVRTKLDRLLEATRADELMVLTTVPEPEARKRSYSLLRELHPV